MYVNPTNDIVDSVQSVVRWCIFALNAFSNRSSRFLCCSSDLQFDYLQLHMCCMRSHFSYIFFCSQNKVCFPYLRKIIEATTVFHWYFHSIFLESTSICMELFLCLSHTAQYAYNVQNMFDGIALHGSTMSIRLGSVLEVFIFGKFMMECIEYRNTDKCLDKKAKCHSKN